MLDSFRAEFPTFSAAVARLRPRVAQEPAPWAFLSALGASMIIAGIARIALLAAPTPLLDPSKQWPFGATLGSMTTFVSSLVLGAVLVRAGGRRALLTYAAYVLLGIAISLPQIMLFCDRSGNDGSCRVPLVYIAAGRAPEWIGVTIGVILARWVCESGPGANLTLRGAGAFSFALFVMGIPYGFLSYTGALGDATTGALLYVIAEGVAGAIAGVVLARGRFGGALLVALVILGPAMGFALPLLRAGPGGELLEFTVARWSSVLAPVVGALATIAGRGLARRRLDGTFF